ncbi:hypothetical protein KFL_000790210 [Klebsormidium nitens]|uniref:CobW C-terminal domain-containing protein n=1 Tax=Klebsormidium nitens TaxID=105231 RepID=A0A1Y1HXZ0_KLENI|nr:hypothetical protein KFL_000790210 [Klebsormidium nitens]|eukprot:GAQ81396.1 hypothetical protein KFL_000790210 [Klebsormidium nitens]
MSLALERRIFASSPAGRAIPCTLVTGFLGSGKTTLVRHILASKGDLRIAVLVNEFGQADIDGALLNTTQTSASLGIAPPRALSHGCACCDTSEEFRAAVRGMLESQDGFDYLVVETSGLSDPQPMAHALMELGVRLDMVVAVVDAEALCGMLENEVARRQLAAADLVLVNKCDLVSLAGVSDVEDRVEALTGGTKAVRCRYSRVPLELVLNIDIRHATTDVALATNGASGYLSHERVRTSVKLKMREPEGVPVRRSKALGLTKMNEGTKRMAGGNDNNGHSAHLPGGAVRDSSSHPGSESNRRFDEARCSPGFQAERGSSSHAGPSGHVHVTQFGSTSVHSEVPLSLAAFQEWVLERLLTAGGVLRAKGIAWFAEDRSRRYVFQYSGRQRLDLHTEGLWESPPHTSVVLIGRDKAALPGLESTLEVCADRTLQPTDETRPVPPSQAFRDLMARDDRFKLVAATSCFEADTASSAPFRDEADTLVRFVLKGDALRGVDQRALTESLIAKVNGHRKLLLAAVDIHSEGCVAQMVLGPAVNAEDAWALVAQEAGKARAAAFKNIHACRCDFTRS